MARHIAAINLRKLVYNDPHPRSQQNADLQAMTKHRQDLEFYARQKQEEEASKSLPHVIEFDMNKCITLLDNQEHCDKIRKSFRPGKSCVLGENEKECYRRLQPKQSAIEFTFNSFNGGRLKRRSIRRSKKMKKIKKRKTSKRK